MAVAGGNASARRRKSTSRFDGNVTRAVSTASKEAAEERKSSQGVSLGLVGVVVFVIVVVGSSLVDMLRPAAM